MALEKFLKLESGCIPLAVENVDTDQIIPARFLKATSREGFGNNLFRDWRFDGKGNPITNFVFNDQRYSGKILVAGRNFGCGSSREHAAWAIYDYGFRAIISSFFADIFTNNALNNGLLPVMVSDKFLKDLFRHLNEKPDLNVIIDLSQQLVVNKHSGATEHFGINSYKKNNLLKGYDDLDYLISVRKEIENFERTKTQTI